MTCGVLTAKGMWPRANAIGYKAGQRPSWLNRSHLCSLPPGLWAPKGGNGAVTSQGPALKRINAICQMTSFRDHNSPGNMGTLYMNSLTVDLTDSQAHQVS